MKQCPTCHATVPDEKIFCTKECYWKRHDYGKHSEETKHKIAIGNSKPFTDERKHAISVARTFVPTQELLDKLQSYWELKYLNPFVVAELCGLKGHKSVYRRLVKEYCNVTQMTFMPKNWYPEHYQKLFELGAQNVWYVDIAKMIGFSAKQTFFIAKKLGLKLRTRNPNAYSCTTSKPEKTVIGWLTASGLSVDAQFPLGNFLFDAHVQNTNVLVEVNGDYWHCNPRVYVNGAINNLQKAHQRRDFCKKACAVKLGYYLITVWELDIKQRPEDMRQWLLKKVKEHATARNDDGNALYPNGV